MIKHLTRIWFYGYIGLNLVELFEIMFELTASNKCLGEIPNYMPLFIFLAGYEQGFFYYQELI